MPILPTRTETTEPLKTDAVYVVRDPEGTPSDHWTGIGNFLRYTTHEAYTPHYPYKCTLNDNGASVMTANTTALNNALAAARNDGKAFVMDAGDLYIDGMANVQSTVNSPLRWTGVPGARLVAGGGTREALIIDPDSILGTSQSFSDGLIGGFTLECDRKTTNAIRLRQGVIRSHILHMRIRGYAENGIYLTAQGTDTRFEPNVSFCYIEGDRNGITTGDQTVASGWGIRNTVGDGIWSHNYCIGHEQGGMWLGGSTHFINQCHCYVGFANPNVISGNPWMRVALRLGRDGGGSFYFVEQCQLNAEIHTVEFHGASQYHLRNNLVRAGVQQSDRLSPYDDPESSAAYYFRANNHFNFSITDDVLIEGRSNPHGYKTPDVVAGAVGASLQDGGFGYRIEPKPNSALFDRCQTTLLSSEFLGTFTLNSDGSATAVDPSPFRLLGNDVNWNGYGQAQCRLRSAGAVEWDYNTSTHQLTFTPQNAPGANARTSYEIQSGGNHTF